MPPWQIVSLLASILALSATNVLLLVSLRKANRVVQALTETAVAQGRKQLQTIQPLLELHQAATGERLNFDRAVEWACARLQAMPLDDRAPEGRQVEPQGGLFD